MCRLQVQVNRVVLTSVFHAEDECFFSYCCQQILTLSDFCLLCRVFFVLQKVCCCFFAAGMQKHQDKSKKQNVVESLGERVFVTSPRVFSFSHRALTSVRHPFVPLTLATLACEAEGRGKKSISTGKAERMAEYIADFPDEEKWKAVARMLDSMMFEKDISVRRQHALENASLRRALETWWCKAGGTPLRGITEDSYKQVHSAIYRELLQVSDVAMHGIITKAIAQDWMWDSDGKGEVSFGKWYLSVLEIADNWVPTCDGESYGQFLESLLQKVFPKPSTLKLAVDSNQASFEWSATCAMIQRNSRVYKSTKIIQKSKSVRHTTVFSAVSM